MCEPVQALLAEIGFEAFEDQPDGTSAYVPVTQFDRERLEDCLTVLETGLPPLSVHHHARINWNARWEADYPSVYVDSFCQIVPSFRAPLPGYAHTIIIDPKMSFGTGHHETTRLMIRQLARLAPAGQQVLDMGCGTGVLGILAARMGAAAVTAIDIDPWSVENCGENILLNDTPQVQVLLGDASALPTQTFDLILANINRNVLLADLPAYVNRLAKEGILVISGFYERDVPVLLQTCEALGLKPDHALGDNDWTSLALRSV
ncbi:MAG: 50S ribosomal protein L11 methyltransferase [Bacteroidia bacterium]